MRIHCPWCGERSDAEFRCAGEAAERPGDPARLDDRQWAQYLYGRDNQPGLVRELWWHWAGCRQWLLIERDTVSHRVAQVAAAIDHPLARTGLGEAGAPSPESSGSDDRPAPVNGDRRP